jgi:hypothetical protein
VSVLRADLLAAGWRLVRDDDAGAAAKGLHAFAAERRDDQGTKRITATTLEALTERIDQWDARQLLNPIKQLPKRNPFPGWWGT